jgi:hypothetical protein
MRKQLLPPFGNARNGRMAVVWPARVAERRERRWTRVPEPWEVHGEVFEGETVLRDLAGVRADVARAERIVARYVAVRLLVRADAARLAGAELASELATVDAYLVLLPPSDPERRALETALQFGAGRQQKRLATALIAAGVAAESHGHVAGAFRLYRAAYEWSVAREWRVEGARAARAIERSAARGGGARSARLWERRARVLERSADQD